MQLDFCSLFDGLYSFVRCLNSPPNIQPVLPIEGDKKIERSALPVIQAEAASLKAAPQLKDKQILEVGIKPAIAVALKNAVQTNYKAPEVIDLSRKNSDARASSSVLDISRGITNIGNSCYMNASLQALCQCQGLLEMLADKKPNAAKVNSFREPVVAFLQKLQKKEKVIPKRCASEFMDFLIRSGWSSKEKKAHAHDVYPFVQFLLNSLGVSHKIHGVKVGNGSDAIQLCDLLSPADLSTRKKKKLFLSQNEKRDFFVVALESRFLDDQGRKNRRKVLPSLTLDLPHSENEAKKESYTLSAIIVNPSPFGNAGHYVTYAPQGDKWIEYNDDEVCVHDACDQEARSAIEQHSYLCLYTHIRTFMK